MTTSFNDNGVASVKWRDSMNKEYTCTQESYNKIYKNAEKEIKYADHDREVSVDKIQNKEKKVDEIATVHPDDIEKQIQAKEDRIKELEEDEKKEDRAALMRMSNQDLLDEIERLKKREGHNRSRDT